MEAALQLSFGVVEVGSHIIAFSNLFAEYQKLPRLWLIQKQGPGYSIFLLYSNMQNCFNKITH
jgi:hypothetical protein